MILIELSPPFQPKPSFWRSFGGWRFMWGWLAIAYVDYGWNEFINGLARAGANIERENPGRILKPTEDQS